MNSSSTIRTGKGQPRGERRAVHKGHYTPKVTLRSNRKPLPFLGDPFSYYLEASTANVSEEVPETETPSTDGYTTSSIMNNVYGDILYASDWGWRASATWA